MVIIDHVFICTARKAPAEDLLVRAGLTEGTPNRHTGPGTACRRFIFSSALELRLLEDEAKVQSKQRPATALW